MRPQTELPRLIEALRAEPRFAAALVFGSVARGSARADSDIDLGVLYVDDEARASAGREWLTLLGRLALAAGRDVHLVDLEAADASLRRTVFETGRALLNRAPRRLRDLRVATGIEYLDWAYARRVADAGHARRLAARDG